MKTSLKKLPKSQIEIEFEISAEEFKKHIDAAILHLKEHIKMDGFRPGQVPEKIVEEKAGKENILMEAGDLAVKESYSKFVEENKLEPIGEPEVQVLKILDPRSLGEVGAQGSPFLFKVKITVLPEVKLPDYKKVAPRIKKREISVSQDDIEDALNYLKRSKAKFSQLDKPAQEKDFVEIEYWSPQLNLGKKIHPVKSADEVGGASPGSPMGTKQFNWVKDQFILGEGGFVPGFEQNLMGMKAGEEKEFSIKFPENSLRKDLAGKETSFRVKMLAVKKVELPEINDEFAKNLGKFENLDSLKANIKEEIIEEKQVQEKQRQREEMLEKIAEQSKIETPEALVDFEKERLFKNFQERITKDLNVSFEDYLNSVKQDEKSVKESFSKEAEKKVKNFLILKEIGKKEDILVSQEEIEEEIDKTIKNYSSDVLKKIDIQQLREYTKGVIHNEKIFQLLEDLSK